MSMNIRFRSLYEGGTAVLAAAFIWHQVLTHRTDLHQAAHRAADELASRGYRVPTAETPLHVHPLSKESAPTAQHGGGWHPGEIWIRESPHGAVQEDSFLRHELMHEATHRTCQKRLPEWVKEGAAIAFSGESRRAADFVDDGAIESLSKAIRLGATLSSRHRETLAHLIKINGWPELPCESSAVIEKRLNPTKGRESHAADREYAEVAGPEYVVVDLISGREVLSENTRHGESHTRLAPIGSLMKIPYVSSLHNVAGPDNTAKIRAALAKSDTDFFAHGQLEIDQGRLCRLLTFGRPGKSCLSSPRRILLGESASDQHFPFQYSIRHAAQMLRAALRTDEQHFVEVPDHSKVDGATLSKAPAAFHDLLAQQRAWAKTGTTSTAKGEPLWGHLCVVWPRESPRYLALFRQRGVRGATLAGGLASTLQKIFSRIPTNERLAIVPLVSQLPSQAMVREGGCLEGPRQFDPSCEYQTTNETIASMSGWWKITSSARNARAVRYVRGEISTRTRLLITDAESYVDGVVSAEGRGLPANAKEALRAVVFWNISKGRDRHQSEETGAPLDNTVCDTTHCMVFLGVEEMGQGRTNVDLVRLLTQINGQRALADRGWFEFSTGGTESWSRTLSAQEVSAKLGVTGEVDVKRERTREGAVVYHLHAPSEDRILNCDSLMLPLDLPSCPTSIVREGVGQVVRFEGAGGGHGRGLDLVSAAAAARRGASGREILQKTFLE